MSTHDSNGAADDGGLAPRRRPRRRSTAPWSATARRRSPTGSRTRACRRTSTAMADVDTARRQAGRAAGGRAVRPLGAGHDRHDRRVLRRPARRRPELRSSTSGGSSSRTSSSGFGLFLALFFIGAGAVHWAKTLMPDEERVEYRHLQRGTDEERAEAVRILKEGAAETGLGRRPLIRNTLIGRDGAVPAARPSSCSATPARCPARTLSTTMWKRARAWSRRPGRVSPIKAADLTIGSVVHVMPEGIEEAEHPLEEGPRPPCC